MKNGFNFKTLMALAMFVVVPGIAGITTAGHHDLLKRCGVGKVCCPKCNHCCTLEAEKVDVEKSCFEVECETVCVPRVVFPWQTGHWCFPWSKKNRHRECDVCDGRGCDRCYPLVHNGARIRTVKVLKTKKYKCPECEYSWTPNGDGCGPDCDGGCDYGCDNYSVDRQPGPVIKDRPAAPVSYQQRLLSPGAPTTQRPRADLR